MIQKSLDNKNICNDFEILKIINLTTNTPLLSEKSKVEVIGCDSNNITIYAENSKWALGHLVSLEAIITLGNKKQTLLATGKIVDLNILGNLSLKAIIRITQFDKNLWKKFILSLTAKQKHIDKLLISIKGEE